MECDGKTELKSRGGKRLFQGQWAEGVWDCPGPSPLTFLSPPARPPDPYVLFFPSPIPSLEVAMSLPAPSRL